MATGTTGSTRTASATPTAAERIRSAYSRAQALLAVEGADPAAVPVCHLSDDGTVLVAIPATIPTGADGIPAMLELTDHAPLRLRERVRALVWIRGSLATVPDAEVGAALDRIAAADPNPALLQVWSPQRTGAAAYRLARLTVASAVLADATGAEAVGIDAVLAAQPDPLCTIEAGWLHHLDTTHPEVVARLTAKAAPRLQHGRVRPLGVDRHGIWLRVEGDDGDHDLRLTFDRPVSNVTELNRAVRALMGCPFLNGLHARRG